MFSVVICMEHCVFFSNGRLMDILRDILYNGSGGKNISFLKGKTSITFYK